ncbi:MAG: hypothetical protein BMS9Abin07_1947 [Acidimicrobiia bacterium]|nr:MAG: hypothetical protein BMS9Abin07_1947 [Acidimicrobiia bacterium]
MSDEAIRLNGGPRYAFYAEFDTTHESEAWKEYIYDPLKMLVAEGVPLPEENGDLGINILKLEEEEGYVPPDPDEHERYVEMVTARCDKTLQLLEEYGDLDPSERERHVSTLVVNHQVPLNPRIGTTYA